MREIPPEDNQKVADLIVLLSGDFIYTGLYNGSVLSFDLENDYDENLEILNYFFNDVTTLIGKKVEIKLHTVKFTNFYVFYDEKEYFNRYEKYKSTFYSDHVIVLNQQEILVKYPDEQFTEKKAEIFNYYIYRKIIEFLIDKPEFTPYHDNIKKQFVIISSEKGAFHIGYSLNPNILKLIDNLHPNFEILKKGFEKIEFTQFFKESVINAVHQFEVNDRFIQLIKNLNIICNFADRDHQAYVLKFAFDKIRSKFKEERNKYFENIDKSIDTISKQVTSFPLTFAATAFASYQVKDKPLILVFVFIAYSLYTFIAWKVIDVTSYNSQSVKNDALKEKKTIRTTYNVLYSDFKYDFQKIFKKLRKLNQLIFILRCILILLLVIFGIFVIFQFLNNEKNKPMLTVPLDKVNIIVDDASNKNYHKISN